MQVFRIIDFFIGINFAGENYTSPKGLYEADTHRGLTSGKKFSTNTAIQGTDDDILYQSERFLKSTKQKLTYNIDVPNGVYYVEFEMAELFFHSPGKRVFDMKLEGVTVEDDIDLIQRVGAPFTAYTTGHFVTVTDGTLTLSLHKGVQNPKINAMAIYTAEEDTSGPAVSIALTGGKATLDPLNVVVTFSDESGLDTSSIQLSDVQVTGQVTVQSESVFFESSDVAYATLSLLPTSGWVDGQTVEITVPADAVQDSGGGGNLIATAGFQYFQVATTSSVDSIADLTQLTLLNIDVTNPTAIDVGADGRIYLAQQNGLIMQLTIVHDVVESGGVTTQTFTVTERVDITAVQDMPNFNDFGCYDSSVNNRQVTGLVATTDSNGLVMLYVSSSDPRIGGGSGGESEDLDTNSGVISRLKQSPDGQGGFTWDKVDMVRGFPRSEENHATNGMRLYTKQNGDEVLLVASGGNTNTGAPSNNFVFLMEYYYSGTMLAIDLEKLKTLEAQGISEYEVSGKPKQFYLYDLPTLDDPSRDNVNGLDGPHDSCNALSFDVMGGNNGLNQAIYDPEQIVWVIASGFRNQYDVVIFSDGSVYTVDNGSNSGWGGNPIDANGNMVVDDDNDLVPDVPLTNRANEEGGSENNGDGLHRIIDDIDAALGTNPDNLQTYYAGHPNPFRGYGGGAGLYWYASANNQLGVPTGTPLDVVNKVVTAASDEVDLTSKISNIGDMTGSRGPQPHEAMPIYIGQRKTGVTNAPNGALWTWKSSTNGVDEYKAGTGDLKGQLLTVSFNGDISAVKFKNDGTVDEVTLRGLTSKPLDLCAQGDDDPFPGVVFVAAYGSDKVVILSPEATLGDTPNPNDRDGDGIDDTIDPFCVDPENGLVDTIVPGEKKTWTFVNGNSFPNENPGLFDGSGGLYNGGDIGFTGIFTNRGTLPEGLYDNDNIIFGGAPGILQIKATDAGNATINDAQRNGFQLGVNPIFVGLTDFTVRSKIDTFLDEISSLPATERLEQGIQVGSGDQNNFVSLSLVRLEDGKVGFEVVSQFTIEFFGALPATIDFYEVPALENPSALDTVELGFDINIAAGEVKPVWKFTTDEASSTTSGSGSKVVLSGECLASLQGTYQIADDEGTAKTMGFAVGIVASRGCSCGGRAIAALNAGSTSAVTQTVNGLSTTFEPDAFAAGVTIVGSTTEESYGSIAVPDTNLDKLYEDERRGDTSWGYSVETGINGEFSVDLYFVEREYSSAGNRVFDVQVEGVVVATDFDIYAAAGSGEAALSSTVTVTDGTVDILFVPKTGDAIVNGVIVREKESPPFLTDWDDLVIEGFGTAPADDTPPIASLEMTDAEDASDNLLVLVTMSDDRGLDQSTIGSNELTIGFSGSHTVTVVEPLDVSEDGTTATITYGVKPVGGWSQGDTFNIKLAAGAISDQDGNGNAEVSDLFSFGRGQLFLAVNEGTSKSVTTSDGIVYQGGYEAPISCCKIGNGKATDTSADISGTVDDDLYYEWQWSKRDASWSIPVPSGNYYVELHFAETQFTAPNARVFDISIEGFSWLVGYDIYATVGPATADVYSEVVEVTDGALNLIMEIGSQYRPMICAFSIWKTTQAPTLFIKSE